MRFGILLGWLALLTSPVVASDGVINEEIVTTETTLLAPKVSEAAAALNNAVVPGESTLEKVEVVNEAADDLLTTQYYIESLSEEGESEATEEAISNNLAPLVFLPPSQPLQRNIQASQGSAGVSSRAPESAESLTPPAAPVYSGAKAPAPVVFSSPEIGA